MSGIFDLSNPELPPEERREKLREALQSMPPLPSSDERETPADLFNALNKVFQFDWDVAARLANCKVIHQYKEVAAGKALTPIRVFTATPPYFGPDHPEELYRDALATISWADVFYRLGFKRPHVWCNPPYSRQQLSKWLQKARCEAEAGVTTVMLLPGDTSTEWFHSHVRGKEWYTKIGRGGHFAGAPLTSDGKKAPAFFPSHLVVFRPPMPAVWRRP